MLLKFFFNFQLPEHEIIRLLAKKIGFKVIFEQNFKFNRASCFTWLKTDRTLFTDRNLYPDGTQKNQLDLNERDERQV